MKGAPWVFLPDDLVELLEQAKKAEAELRRREGLNLSVTASRLKAQLLRQRAGKQLRRLEVKRATELRAIGSSGLSCGPRAAKAPHGSIARDEWNLTERVNDA